MKLFISLLRCVQELWQHGYVHRDIKPHNVMKTNDKARQFILLDFRIAFAVNETSITCRAEDRMPMATYRYLAPEMLLPDFRDRIDYRTDLYTTGMTVYEYAAGKHPLAKNTDDLMQTISRALNPMENLWHYLKSHYWSNRAYADYEELEEAAIDAWQAAVLNPDLTRTICNAPYFKRAVSN